MRPVIVFPQISYVRKGISDVSKGEQVKDLNLIRLQHHKQSKNIKTRDTLGIMDWGTTQCSEGSHKPEDALVRMTVPNGAKKYENLSHTVERLTLYHYSQCSNSLIRGNKSVNQKQ
jgi:hypothetical protein